MAVAYVESRPQSEERNKTFFQRYAANLKYSSQDHLSINVEDPAVLFLGDTAILKSNVNMQ